MSEKFDNKNKGAGWVKTAKSGSKFISIKMNIDGKDYNLSMFKNERKAAGSSQPDYNLLLSDYKKGQPKNDFSDPFKDAGFSGEEVKDSDIPF